MSFIWNRGIAFDRCGRHPDALSALRLVRSPRLLRRAEAARIRVQLALGRKQVAFRTAQKLARMRRTAEEHYDAANEAEILAASRAGLKAKPA
jgi:hypothetical protein